MIKAIEFPPRTPEIMITQQIEDDSDSESEIDEKIIKLA